MKINDNNFIKELRRKNEDALEFVLIKYGGLLRSVICRILYDHPQDAEECLYDTILKIWDHIESYDTSVPFKGWAVVVAKHTALDKLRKLKRLEPAVDIDELPIADISGLTGDALFDNVFSELISCLNDTDKTLFTRIFWNGEDIGKVSGELGMSRSIAYNHISRGKKKIIQNNPTRFAGGSKK